MATGNPFATEAMARGYSAARPPLHRPIVARAWSAIGVSARAALDVGCGAGLSTQALPGSVPRRVGVEPAVAMLRWATGADFAAARAEALPFPSRTFDLLTAAGSLNYVTDLPAFFGEAQRVLRPGGALLVYDFDSPSLGDWQREFHTRYPNPPSERRPLDPERLASLDPRFTLAAHEHFALPLSLEARFYVDYQLTEANVAAAVRRGTAVEEVRAWLESTLVWEGLREVRFPGYWAVLRAAAR
ncbi:MAG: class I SAM-dependent methyltransferase [Bryobacterales bacterium]|nr:class I SAM-dependent methyltransferase [Bryobacterales bacterium]